MSLYATNINTHTLQGSSRGTETLRIGFEFDIPLTSLGRWLSIFAPPKRAEAKPPAEPVGGAVEVRIRDYKFFPAQLTVRKGTTVRFLNEDPVPHTATADDGSFDSGLFRQGESWSHRFDAPGSFPYFCAVHPYMRAEVRVED
ncbi:MAG: cupredoxin family copper-binding protein [Myxococcales bacterium]|nr:cupredoxin family copper-binding protein [Myxococcales bacterium]